MADQLRDLSAARPVYVPTDYLVPGGMSLAQLHECAQALAQSEVVGVGIGELEASSVSTGENPERLIVKTLEPLLVCENANAA